MGSYAPPTFNTAGLTIPGYSAIFNFFLQNYLSIYGQNITQDNSNPDIQLMSIVALAASDAMSALQEASFNQSPNFATGAALSSLVQINGLSRKVASYSTVTVTLTGTANTIITNGILVDPVFGYQWTLPSPIQIGAGGTVTTTATCTTIGAVNLPASSFTSSSIATPTAGWTGVSNVSASVPGQPVEADSALRTRQAASVALPSQTILDGTYAALSALDGVTRLTIDNNTTSSTDGAGTPGHSIQAVVEGGVAAEIAQAIYNNKGLGCGTYGSQSYPITDQYTGIAETINWNQPGYSYIYVAITAHLISGVQSALQAAIQTAVVNYLNSLSISNGNGVVSLGEIYAAAASVNTDPQNPVVSIRSPLYIGFSASPVSSADLPLAFGGAALGLAANVTFTWV